VTRVRRLRPLISRRDKLIKIGAKVVSYVAS
jgi:hypothetical protein